MFNTNRSTKTALVNYDDPQEEHVLRYHLSFQDSWWTS